MSLRVEPVGEGDTVRLSVAGRFDFCLHHDFRKAQEAYPPAAHDFVVDLGQAEYMDSSALGMLLMLREEAEKGGRQVRLVNCRPETREILAIANFDRLFVIE